MVQPAPGSSEGTLSFMLRAMRYRNYRLYFSGQLASLIGTWLTILATSWLVYRLAKVEYPGRAPLILGIVGFAGQIPIFLLSPLAGVWIDRWNRHRVLVATQSLSMLQSFALAGLALGGVIQIWHVLVLNALQGVVNAFDVTARQAFVVELVENREDLSGAIALEFVDVPFGPPARSRGRRLADFDQQRGDLLSDRWFQLPGGAAGLAGDAFDAAAGPAAARFGPAGLCRRTPVQFRFPADSLAAGVGRRQQPVGNVAVGADAAVCRPGARRQRTDAGLAAGRLRPGRTDRQPLSGLAPHRARLGPRHRLRQRGLGPGHDRLFLFDSLPLSLAILPVVGGALVVEMASANTVLQTIVDDDKRARVMGLFAVAVMGMAPIGSLLAGTVANFRRSVDDGRGRHHFVCHGNRLPPPFAHPATLSPPDLHQEGESCPKWPKECRPRRIWPPPRTNSRPPGGFAVRRSSRDDVPVNVRQPPLDAVVIERQSLVVDAQQVQDRGVEIVHRTGSSWPTAKFVGLAVGKPGLETGSGHPDAERF